MHLEVDITKSFPGFTSTFQFTLRATKCGVFGPSGNGKSTLMHLLAGLLEPDSGSIILDGRALYDSSNKINLPPEQRRVGVVFQHAHLFPHMSVAKNLFYGMKRTPAIEREINPERLIAILQLEHLMNRPVSKLSGGERQRVALGRTILACPKLILLDEPLSGLDNRLKYEIIPQLRQVFEEFSIPFLFISHSLQEMRMMTEEVLVIERGKIAKQFTTEELARTSLGSGGRGYTNLLELKAPEDVGKLLSYKWGEASLMLLKTKKPQAGTFSINSRDILLFKKDPEATSARNMLHCTVKNTYETDWLTGIELDCKGQTLIAEIVPQSLKELGLKPGSEIVAVFKASAFERLW